MYQLFLNFNYSGIIYLVNLTNKFIKIIRKKNSHFLFFPYIYLEYMFHLKIFSNETKIKYTLGD